MNKVYCGKCKNLSNILNCNHKDNLAYRDTPIERYSYYKDTLSILNKNNDCRNYERRNKRHKKWWKFWA